MLYETSVAKDERKPPGEIVAEGAKEGTGVSPRRASRGDRTRETLRFTSHRKPLCSNAMVHRADGDDGKTWSRGPRLLRSKMVGGGVHLEHVRLKDERVVDGDLLDLRKLFRIDMRQLTKQGDRGGRGG